MAVCVRARRTGTTACIMATGLDPKVAVAVVQSTTEQLDPTSEDEDICGAEPSPAIFVLQISPADQLVWDHEPKLIQGNHDAADMGMCQDLTQRCIFCALAGMVYKQNCSAYVGILVGCEPLLVDY